MNAYESTLVAAGLWLFLTGAAPPRGRATGLAVLALLTLVFTILGMTIAPAPPSVQAMAASSLLTIAAVCALAGWLGSTDRSPDPSRSRVADNA
ncbi:MAG: hypothetical protein KA169_18580 [Burkholderiaceae bacterium]|nr:hypothetical protein [Burkholderiaceae bacterium]